jgi:hypothetical protein
MSKPERTRPAARQLPGRGEHAKLTTRQGEQLPVSVAEHGEDVLLLVLLSSGDDAADWSTKMADELVLEAMGPRGLVRLYGTAEAVESDLVRFHILGEPEQVQRRNFVRIQAPLDVTVDNALGQHLTTNSVDISGGGMLLNGPQTLMLDERIRFRLQLAPGEPPIEGRARVVRTGRDNKRAVVFEEIDRDARERLIHFVFDRQRAALAITRGDAF